MFYKKKLLFMVSLLLVVTIVLAGCGSDSTSSNNGGSDTKVIEMDVSNYNPSTHSWGSNVYEPWKKYVEEKTNGRVKVNVYHGGALGGSGSVYQDVKGGLYDVGLVVANYFYDTGFFPYTIGSLPFAFDSSESAHNVLGEFAQKYTENKLTDIVVMGATSTDAYDIFSSGPVRSVDDLKKLKMRVNGKSEPAFVDALGGVPVSLVTEEIYEGLEKGTINTAFYTPIGSIGMKMFEPAPYVTKLGVSVTPLVPVMNKDFFNELPDDLKKLFEEDLNPKFAELFTQNYTNLLEESYKTLEKEVSGKGEIITLSDEEMKNFKEAGNTAWDAWIKDANAKGYDGEKMVEEFSKMLEEEGYPTPF
jgi:TRAP-type transport system periplasmic protein